MEHVCINCVRLRDEPKYSIWRKGHFSLCLCPLFSHLLCLVLGKQTHANRSNFQPLWITIKGHQRWWRWWLKNNNDRCKSLVEALIDFPMLYRLTTESRHRSNYTSSIYLLQWQRPTNLSLLVWCVTHEIHGKSRINHAWPTFGLVRTQKRSYVMTMR